MVDTAIHRDAAPADADFRTPLDLGEGGRVGG